MANYKNPLNLSEEFIQEFQRPHKSELQNVVDYSNNSNKPTYNGVSTPDQVQKKQNILSQIIQVRDSGLTNMFDADNVARIADEAQFQDLSDYIKNNRNAYIQFILKGKDGDLPNI